MKHTCTCKHLPFQFIDSVCLRGNLSCFCRLLIFFKSVCLLLLFSKKKLGSFVGLDLGPNCLQRLSADDTSK